MFDIGGDYCQSPHKNKDKEEILVEFT